MPRSATSTSGLDRARSAPARRSASRRVVTSAPAASSTSRNSVSASASSSTASTRMPRQIGQPHQRLPAFGPRVLAAATSSRSGCTIISGSRTRNVAPWPFAGAGGMHGAAVHLDDVPHDRETEPEPAGLAGRAGVGLAEALEHVRQEVGADADAGVADDDLECEFTRSSRTCTRPPFGVNFTAFDSRFQTTCCRRSGSPETGPTRGSRIVCMRTPLASAAGCTVATALSTIRGRSTGCTSSRILPDDDPRHVEHVLDDLRQRRSRCARASRGRGWPSRRSACRRAAGARSRGSR